MNVMYILMLRIHLSSTRSCLIYKKNKLNTCRILPGSCLTSVHPSLSLFIGEQEEFQHILSGNDQLHVIREGIVMFYLIRRIFLNIFF